MSKTKAPKQEKSTPENERALRELSAMKHKDLKIACVLRGMPPEDVVKSDHHKLVSYFMKYYDNSQNENLLIEFDVFVEKELRRLGYKDGDAMLSPSLRLSYVRDFESIEKVKQLKPSSVVKTDKKEKAPVDEDTGVRSGTKKAMTYSLAYEGKPIPEIIKLVKKAFPDAKDKSISIWAKRAIKEKGNAV